MADSIQIPDFDNLTIDPKGPHGNAWGLFGAEKAELGMLNLLTPAVVHRTATEEIRTGVHISLDWDLNKPANPSFARAPFKHEVWNRAPRAVNDDILHFNSQCSSQWDGFRHYGNQKLMCYYNGHTQHELSTTTVLGVDAWLKKGGGIAGRGVLLDYVDYATRNNIAIEPFTSTDIPLSALEAMATEANISFRSGDILFIRSGFVAAYEALSPEEEPKICQRESADFLGVRAGEATLRWLWKNQFAAIAGDMPSFERAPVTGPHADVEHTLHQWCLAGWGMPIGEMFNLEELAAHCKREQRWTFFVSSAPLRIPGGCASPPNAIAFF